MSMMSIERKKLPVFSKRATIIETIRNNPITLIEGQTGSGKTTQIPQYLLEENFGDASRQIICTQPRTVAATSVAKRVAFEQNSELGNLVGYQVRLESKETAGRTVLVYMTEGTLLRKAMCKGNLDLKKFSVILIDEAHERTVNGDLLMGFLKKTVKERKDFRVVIMSATLNVERFLDYFNNPPLIRIEGKNYPVSHYFLDTPTDNYIATATQIVAEIHAREKSGDILVFLPGAQQLEEAKSSIQRATQRLEVYVLYGQMFSGEQEKVFLPTQNGYRKCVVATNVAETSLTIDGIVYIIDCGFSKQKTYDPFEGIQSLSICPISKASVKQRCGRAGRTQPGKAYHLYSFQCYCDLRNETPPEILRSDLVNETLDMLALGITNPLEFDYIDPPHELTLARALKALYDLGAIDDRGKITNLGLQMARFPVDPRMAKAILRSKDYKCSKEILSIAAMMETKDKIFRRAFGAEKERSEEKRKLFSHSDGDHLTLLNVYNSFKALYDANRKDAQSFCKSMYIDYFSLQRTDQIRNQLERILVDPDGQKNSQKIEFENYDFEDSEYFNNILKALLSGYFLNVAVYDCDDKYLPTRIIDLYDGHKAVELSKARIHRSSVLHKSLKRNWIIFDEVVFQQISFLKCVSAIQPIWLLEVAPDYYNVEGFKNCQSPIAKLLKDLHEKKMNKN